MAVWTDNVYAFKEILTSAKLNAEHANFFAVTEGAASAPRVQLDALDDSAKELLLLYSLTVLRFE